MKKKLEGELISIAHRVLKLKNRSETILLQREAKKLYEQLTVLRFYEENFEALKDDISQEQLEEKLEQMTTIAAVETTDLEEKVAEVAQPIEKTKPVEEVEQPTEVQPTEVVSEELVKEEIIAEEIVSETVEPTKEEVYATADDINRIVSEMSKKKNVSEETPVQDDVLETKKSSEPQQISFEDLLGDAYKEPEFVRVEDTPKEVKQATDLVFDKKEEVEETKQEAAAHAADVIFERANELPKPEIKEEYNFTATSSKQEAKPKSLNDRLTSGISFGLNDRIAFEKKLFGGSADDFNRVISQLNTFDSFDEAKSFITDFVKPDYKNWEGQEEFETRFLEIIEKKFN